MEVSVCEDTTEAACKRAKVPMRGRRDVDPVEKGLRTGGKEGGWSCDAYREGNARGELRRAVALSTVCRM